MKIIQLTQGQVTLVSDEDFERVSQHKWYANYHKSIKGFYAESRINNKIVRLHRFIMKVTDPKIEVDHKFGNTLDNRRANLRVCTHTQNNTNKPKRAGFTSQYKGVSFCKRTKKWVSQIHVNYHTIFLGRFAIEHQAASAYNQAAIKYQGEFAVLNSIAP